MQSAAGPPYGPPPAYRGLQAGFAEQQAGYTGIPPNYEFKHRDTPPINSVAVVKIPCKFRHCHQPRYSSALTTVCTVELSSVYRTWPNMT